VALSLRRLLACFFFFKEEAARGDWSVTGFQTCALPISRRSPCTPSPGFGRPTRPAVSRDWLARAESSLPALNTSPRAAITVWFKIGRASCRERVEISVGAGSLKKKKGSAGSARE